jgi:hypothetical protein
MAFSSTVLLWMTPLVAAFGRDGQARAAWTTFTQASPLRQRLTLSAITA